MPLHLWLNLVQFRNKRILTLLVWLVPLFNVHSICSKLAFASLSLYSYSSVCTYKLINSQPHYYYYPKKEEKMI
ncbi:Uncharacterized protein TCM_019381 [Theobroma cacao]|uniref:Uncharacterized protein n=1 Tax=Theobroma cacao TaxID=3641 RepID=A0A061EI93_THECC|nr:Uncharacterized protein TCM_019381 [Theobroma cacao]